MANGTFWDIPGKVVFAATVVIVAFLVVAYYLYQTNFSGAGTPNLAFFLKVADAFINGAIVGVFLAVLRLVFELPKLLPFLKGKFGL